MKNSENTHLFSSHYSIFWRLRENLFRLKNQLIADFNLNDKWIIVYDNSEPKNFTENENEQIIILKNNSIQVLETQEILLLILFKKI